MKFLKNYFNILELHDSNYDKSPRSWIRAKGRNLLRLVNKILPENSIPYLKEIIQNETGISLSTQTISGWLKGTYGIPVVALKLICKNEEQILKVIKEIEILNVNSTHKITLPKKLTTDFFYFYGALAGDGTLPFSFNSKGYRRWKIAFHMVPLDYVKNTLCKLALDLFNIRPKTYLDKSEGKQLSIFMNINSKIVFRFFEKIIESSLERKLQLYKYLTMKIYRRS